MRRNQNADSTGGGGTHQAGGSSLTAAMNLASNGSSGSSLSTQQLQQLLAAAVGGSSAQQQVASRPNLSSILAGLQQQAHQPQLQTNQSDASSNIMQQLGYYQLIQNAQQGAQNAAQSQSALDNQSAGGTFDAAKAASLLLAGGQLSQLQSLLGGELLLFTCRVGRKGVVKSENRVRHQGVGALIAPIGGRKDPMVIIAKKDGQLSAGCFPTAGCTS